MWTDRYESRFLRVDPERRLFQVNRRAFNDPAIFEEEKQKVLMRSWTFLGHASEIRAPNDFVLRQVLDKRILFTRDKDGTAHAFLNACPHRGARVCREKAGNRKSFTCIYHGWTFRNNGQLLLATNPEAYPADLNSDGRYDLVRVPRLESRADFYFVNFDPEAPSLDEYLDGAGARLDMVADHSAAGLEVIQGCHEYTIRANYKLFSENTGDGYHFFPAHESYLDYLTHVLQGTEINSVGGQASALGHGHLTGETWLTTGRPVAQWLPYWGEEARREIELKRAEMVERLGEERAHLIADATHSTVIFPNTMVMDTQALQVRSVVPVSHREMIVRAWILGPVDESPVLRKIRLDSALSFLGPSGFAGQDDVEILEQAQEGYEMGDGWNDISNGFRPDEDALYGSGPNDGELHIRGYWLQYDRLMGADA